MKTQHTPGPWEIGSINKRDKNLWWAAVFTPKSTGKFHTPRACEALGVDREECEGNARLIAAAPELLEALRDCITSEGASCFGQMEKHPEWMQRRLYAISDIARAAIAKATGGEE